MNTTFKRLEPSRDNRTLLKLEESRKIPKPEIFGFEPLGIDPYKLKIAGYLQGDKLDASKTLSIRNFQRVVFWKFSENAINKKKFIYAFATENDLKNVDQLLVFNYKED